MRAPATAAGAALIGLFCCSAPAKVMAQGMTYTNVEEGRYLVAAGDCAACHTADGGKPFAGGRPVPTPFGTIYSTNITPDKDTGIGQWSREDFYKAMHEGIGPGGKHYYPAFPYPWFTKVSAEDVRAIKAYLDTLHPVHQHNRPPELAWPLSVREVMVGWNKLFFHEGTYTADASKSAEWNRGAYLIQGLGHCGGCHTPINALGAPEKKKSLEGGYGEHWYAMNLTGDVRDGLGNWSPQEIVEYLKTGSNAKAAAAGPMGDVVRNSTQHLSDQDLRAIAAYLKDIPGEKEAAASGKIDPPVMAHGRELYVDNCTGCHMEGGEGLAEVFPPLKGSEAVQSRDATTVVHAVLDGARIVATKDKPTALAMPAFGWKLSDAEIADLVTYIRNDWGNRASRVTAGEVAKVRKQIQQEAVR
jgi:mono/diheme cytochrome c family protein